jgi:hypothetical protein
MHIKVEYSEDGLFGAESREPYDIRASFDEFERMLGDALRRGYPEAEIEITNTLNDRVTVDGDRDHAEIDYIGEVVGETWETWAWLVEAPTQEKQFTVVHGPPYSPISVIVTLNGVLESEPLTPRMAARAARVGCGHRNGVTVWSNDDHGYRLYKDSHRRIRREAGE